MLKPEKWMAAFDREGRVLGFRKALKLISIGGVDPSIRAEVWEFLLGCYALRSTSDFREKLRAARRKRYEELVKECQTMHASIGTGMLAFVIGSKVMDMRTNSKKVREEDPNIEAVETSEVDSSRFTESENNHDVEIHHSCQKESCSDSSDLVRVRQNVNSAAYDLSPFMQTAISSTSVNSGDEAHESHCKVEGQFNFPEFPASNLYSKNVDAEEECESHGSGNSTQEGVSNDSRNLTQECESHDSRNMSPDLLASVQVNNKDLIVQSNGSTSDIAQDSFNSEADTVNNHGEEAMLQSDNATQNSTVPNTSDAPEAAGMVASTSQGGLGEDRVSEWLWNLHRIVVDVVRTDSHLKFYEDQRNLARMSDMLAIYAWVDPTTGYCQGMSDLLSPFIVLFEDDADAFWCFEMLLRRVRDNFRMEGPTGVMQQLLTLWHILELTDREMFSHLSRIGAEGLHFAFRMLHVLFRRELSFNEGLCMWEMMWANDFEDSWAWNLEESCLEPLLLRVPRDSYIDSEEENTGSDDSIRGRRREKHMRAAGMKAVSFRRLSRSFWSRNDHMHSCVKASSSRHAENELPVFCVAAILILNRQKIVKETRCMDDLIKIFNDNVLEIKVRRCIRTAVKLRKKYLYKTSSKFKFWNSTRVSKFILGTSEMFQKRSSEPCLLKALYLRTKRASRPNSNRDKSVRMSKSMHNKRSNSLG